MDHSASSGPGIAPPDDSMSDLAADRPVTAQGPLARLAYTLGGFGLLGATAADSLAVAGRHLGFRILGSIELVQSAVVLLGSSAMLIATLVAGHASVHIVTERLSRPAAARLARLAALVSALVFLVLAAGSVWVASDLWHGFEETELLRIPLRWLRVTWIVFALLIAVIFLRNAARKPA